MRKKQKTFLEKIWYFLWEENSIWSWIANVIIAFILIKFLVYPGLGLILGTSHPIVAVVSSSMEHSAPFDDWWESKKASYEAMGISKDDFKSYPLKSGFNKGDLIILNGKSAQEQDVGDVIVFQTRQPDPVIHRIVEKWEDDSGVHFRTLGDNNRMSIDDERDIPEDRVIGNAVFRIPFLGYVKILFVEVLNVLR